MSKVRGDTYISDVVYLYVYEGQLIVAPETGSIFVTQKGIFSVLARLQASCQLCNVFEDTKGDNPVETLQRPGECDNKTLPWKMDLALC